MNSFFPCNKVDASAKVQQATCITCGWWCTV